MLLFGCSSPKQQPAQISQELQNQKITEQSSPVATESEIAQRMARGEFDAARLTADSAALQFERQGDVYWHWKFKILGARAQIFRGQFQDAIDRLKLPPPPQLATGELALLRKMTLASAEDYSQKFASAEADIADAEEMAAGSPPAIVMQVMQTRGNLEVSQKRYRKAEVAFGKALEISQKLHITASEAQLLGSLGDVSMGLEHFDEAADRYKAALELAKTQGKSASIATTLGNIAWSYDALGDYENARDYYQQAEQAALNGGQAAERIEWLSDLAYVYGEALDYTKAEATANEALTLARKLQDPLSTVQSLNALTEIALQTVRTELAEQYNREALKLEAGGFDHDEIINSELDAGRVAELRGRLNEAEELFSKVGNDPKSRTSSRWESEARLASVYRAENRNSEAGREFEHCLQTVKIARRSVEREESRLSFMTGAIGFYGDYIDFLIDEGRPEQALQIAETSRARTLAEGLGRTKRKSSDAFGNAELRDLAKHLDSTLMCYWLGRRRSHLWVISAHEVSYFPLSGSSDEIRNRIKSYHQVLVESRDALHPLDGDGLQLYELLVKPAQGIIAKNPRVTILPDASLYRLNFETLLVPGAVPHYWIEDVAVTTASSLTLLSASLGRQAKAAKSLLLVGDTSVANKEFPKLDQAAVEMRAVQKYFPPRDTEILDGIAATPPAYLMSHPERFGYVHFVTHGTASLTKPLESAVILSPAGETYKLYARDIVAHPLHANLVTISACNGAGARAYSGEGLVGLSWAFLRAGAHNVIGALWEVNDRSTPQFMDALYGGLSKGIEPAAALRAAKLSFLHSGTVYAKPYYWAPFQLYAGS